MRQVPHYLIIGNGRVAKHFCHYFNQLGIVFSCWHRKLPREQLDKLLSSATHILILISDDAIDCFINSYLSTSKACLIHCSGSLTSEKAYGAHPLMSFSHELYAIEQYQAMTFVVDDDAPDSSELLPGLPNASVRLKKSLKAKYHALCVMAGNFSCILWQKLMRSFEQEFHLPSSISHPFLMQQSKNIMSDYTTALTGPLVRGDDETIAKNIAALEGDSFQEIYKSFVNGMDASQGAKRRRGGIHGDNNDET